MFAQTLIFILCLYPRSAWPQAKGNIYPQQYFRNPLDIPILLAGNFGECRPGHFHSGLDIKTNGKENYKVYAAADGYISRIKTERGGFGHALYITHPNGYTTVYAHLNDFIGPVQQFLRKQQYSRENWEVDISPDPGRFPVKKGQQIAWSGNTGGSTAPHLHFEIRNSGTEHPLNPQLFGFAIADTRPPVFHKLVVYNRELSIYEQKPVLANCKKTKYGYGIGQDTVIVYTAKAGIGFSADDFMNGSDNTLAFHRAELFLDEVLQCAVSLDDIGYDVSRYLHAYADYRTKQRDNYWIQCLFRLPGNRLESIYDLLANGDGTLDLSDGNVHACRIVLTDAGGNESTLRFHLRAQLPVPDTALACSVLLRPQQDDKVSLKGLLLHVQKDALYDEVCLKYERTEDSLSYSGSHQLHRPYVPLHRYCDISLQPVKKIPEALKDKIILKYSDGKEETGKAAVRQDNGWYKASVRNFGRYWLEADTIPPRLVLNGRTNDLATAREIRFSCRDEHTGVAVFRAELDGKWLLFEQRGNVYFYKFDEHCPKGKHTLKVTVRDESGNTAVSSYSFTR